MKSFGNNSITTTLRGAGGWRIESTAGGIIAALAVLVLPLSGQSAANFKVATPQPAKAQPEAPGKTSEDSEIMPSRYVTSDKLPEQIQRLSAILSIRKRTTDPFGQYQDPNAKPVVKTTVAKIKRSAPAQATPFADIIRLIKVTTVMPSEKSFLVGTRTIKEGDRIPLSFRGKNINVQVSAVSSNAIEFRNLENNEYASVRLNLLPAGMTPGNGTITAPGMVADRPDAPIDLDSNSL